MIGARCPARHLSGRCVLWSRLRAGAVLTAYSADCLLLFCLRARTVIALPTPAGGRCMPEVGTINFAVTGTIWRLSPGICAKLPVGSGGGKLRCVGWAARLFN